MHNMVIVLLLVLVLPCSLFADSLRPLDHLPEQMPNYNINADNCSLVSNQFDTFIGTCEEVYNNPICVKFKPEHRRQCKDAGKIPTPFAVASTKRFIQCLVIGGHSLADAAKSLGDLAIWYANYILPIDGRNRGKEFSDTAKQLLDADLAKKFQEFIDEELVEIQCLTHEEQNKRLCKLAANLLIPPAGILAVLKYGKLAARMNSDVAKAISEVKISMEKELIDQQRLAKLKEAFAIKKKELEKFAEGDFKNKADAMGLSEAVIKESADGSVTLERQVTFMESIATEIDGPIAEVFDLRHMGVQVKQGVRRTPTGELVDLESTEQILYIPTRLLGPHANKKDLYEFLKKQVRLYREKSLQSEGSKKLKTDSNEPLPSLSPERPLTDAEKSLRNSKIDKMEPIRTTKSEVYLVTLEDGTKGVWKPQENFFNIDFRAEVLAYEFDRKVGFNLAGEVVEHTHKGQKGSLHLFKKEEFTAAELAADLEKQKLFDFIIGNRDRQPGWNYIVQEGGRIASIDHGLAFKAVSNGEDLLFTWPGVREYVNRPEIRSILDQMRKVKDDPIFRQRVEQYIPRAQAQEFYDRMKFILSLQKK